MATPRERKTRSQGQPVYLMSVADTEVYVVRKAVKSLTMRVKAPDGHVEVSAPYFVSDGFIREAVRERADWIERTSIRVVASTSSRAEGASKSEIEQWRACVKDLVPGLVAKWEPILGVRAGSLAYRNMRSRWGSCQPATGRICINIRLALFPPDCLEYVVVHELCHLRVAGHGKDFYALLDRYLPTWRSSREKLRR